LELGGDIGEAMKKMSEIDAITKQLRGIDCGACGSPSCRAFAEDIVRGDCTMNDCALTKR